MAEQFPGLLLWVWLLGGPLVAAVIEYGRTQSGLSRSRHDVPLRSDTASVAR